MAASLTTALTVPGLVRRIAILGLLLFAVGSLDAQTPVVRQLRNTGPNASRINVAILGDGFTNDQQEQFFSVAQQKLDVLVNNEAFFPFKDLINGIAVFIASNESGTDIAAQGIARDTYYDTGFNGAVNDRLLVVGTTGSTRAQAVLRTHVPDYDISLLIVNTTVYGGAGGNPATFSLNAQSDEIMLHEIGHSFARLTDEYVDAISAPNYAPAEFTNSTQKTARAEIPWRAFVLATTPLPTTGVSTDVNFIGLWEGSHFRATGFYRPNYDSKMRSLNRPFGPVNLRAFANAVHHLNLNRATAPPTSLGLQPVTARTTAGGTLSLAVTAEGVGPFSYQWSQNGKYLAGKTQATLLLTGVSTATLGSYEVEITNAAGTVTSAAAGLTAEMVATGSGVGASYEIQLGSQSTIRWESSAVRVSEDGGVALLTIARGGLGSGSVSVAYTTANGSAVAPADFTGRSGTVTWAEGDSTSKVIAIPLTADNSPEGPESFTVVLDTVRGALLVGETAATIHIVDPGMRDPAFAADFINNTVNRILPLPDGGMLVAGFFSTTQTSAGTTYSFGRIARLGATGALDMSFNPGAGANAVIYALARQPDGKILIGGDFTTFDGITRNRLARLNTDGTLDTAFDPGVGANGLVYDLLPLPTGKILVAGSFTTVNGTAREYIARLNADGSLDSSFTGPDFGDVTGWWVRSLALQADGKILAGGAFYFSGANLRASLCRLNADGSADSSFNGIGRGVGEVFGGPFLGEVKKVAAQPDGRIIIGGNFIAYNQTNRRGVARLASNGSLDTTFNPGSGSDGSVDALHLQTDGKILLGGTFTMFNGASASRLARINPDGSLDVIFASAGGYSTGGINSIVAASDGGILLGGSFGSLQGGSPNRPAWRLLSAVPAGLLAPIITSALTANGALNTAFSYAISVPNSPLTTFAATNLPAGLSLDVATGIISGQPTALGTTEVTLTASNSAGIDRRTLIITVAATINPGRLVNLSLLTSLATATDEFTMGAVIGGSGVAGTKPVLVRAAGPSLGAFEVGGTIEDPRFELFANSTKIGENDNWGGTEALRTAFSQVGAFVFAPDGSKDAALFNPGIAPGNYSVRVTGSAGTTGVVLAELYDSTPSSQFTATTPRLINVSVLKQIGSGFTVGFVIGGNSVRSVLVRAIGPGLAGVGISSGFVDNPRLTLFAGAAQIAQNEDWSGTSALSTAFTQVGAFAIPVTSRDAALLTPLQPGQYSVQVAGPTNATGLVLVEVYEIP